MLLNIKRLYYIFNYLPFNVYNDLIKKRLSFRMDELSLEMSLEMYEGSHRIEKMEAPVVEGSFIASVALKSNKTMDEAIAEFNEQLKND